MRKWVPGLGLGCALSLAVAPAMAASIPPACKSMSDDLLARTGSRVEIAAMGDAQVTGDTSSCTFAHVTLNLSRALNWSIDRLTISSPEIPSGFGKTFPASLQVDATGIRVGILPRRRRAWSSRRFRWA